MFLTVPIVGSASIWPFKEKKKSGGYCLENKTHVMNIVCFVALFWCWVSISQGYMQNYLVIEGLGCWRLMLALE